MIKRIFAALACAALAVAGLLTGVAPASAAAADCPSRYFCFWTDANFSGYRYNLGAGQSNPNLQANPCSGCRSSTNSGANNTWNDMASSVYNRTSTPYCIYFNSGFGGTSRVIYSGGSFGYDSTWNDRMSSVRPAIYRAGSGTIPSGWFCR